ncbi:MAG: YbaK/EbsC family protein [Bacilli bacterium]|nr:YbaK/EbsC family protein [Bacilli bacterium]
MNDVFKYLDNLEIKYEIVYHPAVLTTKEADKFIEGKEGVPSKTMFMSGKKDKKFYLIVMDDSKRLDIKKLNEITNDKLHFGKEEDLLNKMGLVPGVVSIFGLLNNNEHDINIYIDKKINEEEFITFHPNENTATIFIKIKDMYKFLDSLNYKYEIVEL